MGAVTGAVKKTFGAVKDKVVAFHGYVVDKSAKGIKYIHDNLQKLGDLLDKDARYLTLAKVNFDHFLPHSRLAYKAGHQLAIASALRARAKLHEAMGKNTNREGFSF